MYDGKKKDGTDQILGRICMERGRILQSCCYTLFQCELQPTIHLQSLIFHLVGITAFSHYNV